MVKYILNSYQSYATLDLGSNVANAVAAKFSSFPLAKRDFELLGG